MSVDLIAYLLGIRNAGPVDFEDCCLTVSPALALCPSLIGRLDVRINGLEAKLEELELAIRQTQDKAIKSQAPSAPPPPPVESAIETQPPPPPPPPAPTAAAQIPTPAPAPPVAAAPPAAAPVRTAPPISSSGFGVLRTRVDGMIHQTVSQGTVQVVADSS